jgi:hypothetical protein
MNTIERSHHVLFKIPVFMLGMCNKFLLKFNYFFPRLKKTWFITGF